MRNSLWLMLCAGLLLAAWWVRTGAQTSSDPAQLGIEDFNRRLRSATLRMDNNAVMELWAEDGVDLMPGMDPMIGKSNIRKWLDDVVKRYPGYRVVKETDEFHDIRISGDWASEWGTTHQVVQPPDGQRGVETRGKILFVLHKERGDIWKIKIEMWNPGPPPQEGQQGTR
jgi:uncharacterized protein (TIGR02246 family)